MVQINKSDGCFENRFRVDAPDSCASIAVAAQAASNWRMYMRRRKAPAGALPTELMVLVVANFAHFVSAVSLAPSRENSISLRCSSSPNRTHFAGLRFGYVGNKVKRFNSLHTQNRTKGRTSEARLIEPAVHRTDEG